MKKIIIYALVACSIALVGCNTNKSKEPTQNSVQTTDSSKSQETQNKKLAIKNKLDTIEKQLNAQNDAVTDAEIKQQAYISYNKWNTALNEILDTLKQQLSTSDIDKLQTEESNWLKERTDKAKKDSESASSSTEKKLLYYSSLARTTKDRCYQLLNTIN